MSYDIRLGVKVEGMDGYIATIDEPEYSSPTYNLRDMFVACMDWDYEQGEWYNCGDVFQNIIRGQNEITAFPEKYEKFNAPNGWGTVSSAKKMYRFNRAKDRRDYKRRVDMERNSA